MRGTSCAALAGAASIFLALASPAEGSAGQWVLVERNGSAPDRSLLFVDRSSMRRDGDHAIARVARVSEQPQEGGITGVELTYDFRCGARQQRRRDVIFMQADGAAQPSLLAPATWSAVLPGTPAATAHEIACRGEVPAGATSFAGTPFADGRRFFGEPQMASAQPARPAQPRVVPRDELLCRLRHGETAAQVAARPDPAPAACQGVAGRAEQPPARGSAAASDAFVRLLEQIISTDSQDWQSNRYEPGSMRVVNVQSDARGNIVSLRGTYRYIPGGRLSYGTRGMLDQFGAALGNESGSDARAEGWVEARFVNGRLNCLQYHDRSGCIGSTRDYYREANEAQRQHLEYCAVTRNC